MEWNPVLWYNLGMENTTNQYLNNTSSNNDYYTPKQGRLRKHI